MRKGFTLVELIGVIIVLGLIALIALPPILNAIREKESEISEASEEIIYNATSLYVSDNSNSFPKKNGNTFCVTLDTLTQGDYLPDVVYDAVSGDEVPLTNMVEVKYEQDRFSYNLNNECVEKIIKPNYVDASGANAPELDTNMVPIKYDGSNWVYADTSESWYNYDNKEWANAVVLNSGVTKNVGDTITESDIALWYVWIPRYKYQLFNADNGSVASQLINIEFESGTASTGTVSCTDAIATSGSSSETCTNASNGNWYTHPAFTFGEEEITGFWIGKFEVSGSTDAITIKPNVSSLRSTTVSAFFTAIQNMKTTYGLSGDSHMIKNMEWGAVAYLKQSKYGLGETDIGINNNSSYTTGCGETAGSSSSSTCEAYNTTNGMLASTTGNIYGVYDMSGGSSEYVMGNMANSSGAFDASSSGFSSAPDAKYYDAYTYGTDYENHGRGKLGDATKETLATFGNYTGGWYSDYAYFVYSSGSWFARGGLCYSGSGAGVFLFNCYTGRGDITYSSRAVLVP